MNGAEFQFYKMKRGREREMDRGGLYNNVNVLNAAELDTCKWLRFYVILLLLKKKNFTKKIEIQSLDESS